MRSKRAHYLIYYSQNLISELVLMQTVLTLVAAKVISSLTALKIIRKITVLAVVTAALRRAVTLAPSLSPANSNVPQNVGLVRFQISLLPVLLIRGVCLLTHQRMTAVVLVLISLVERFDSLIDENLEYHIA